MTKRKLRRIFAQFFLGFAYLSICFQWLWVIALGLPPLIKAGTFDSFITTAPPTPVAPTATNEPSLLLAVIAGVVTVLFLVITVIVLVRLPKTVSKTGETIVQHTAQTIIPIITHHKKIPTKKKRVLTQQLVIMLRAILVLLPLGTALLLPPVAEISRQVILTLALLMAVMSAIFFVTSWLVRPSTSRTQSHASRE